MPEQVGHRFIGKEADLAVLLEEALPSVTGSEAIFANAPAGTREIWLTLRTAGVTMRGDAGTATAGANGNDFAVNSDEAPYVLPFNQTAALRVRAIENGGVATGWIKYRG